MQRVIKRAAPLALLVASAAFLLSGPLIGATHDEEEFRNTLLTSVLHARALADGVLPYWTSALGFGMPHPMSPSLLLHPFMPLFAWVDPGTVTRLMFVLHAAIGAFGCWLLLRHCGGRSWTSAIAGVTWLLATPSLNYVLTDFWMAEFVAWSLAPWLLLCGLQLLDAPPPGQPWLVAAGFGLVAGLIGANGHSGHMPVFFVALAATFATDWRRARRVWPALALASGIAIAIAAPALVQLATEVGRFPDARTRSTSETLIRGRELVDLVLRPLTVPPAAMLTTVLDRGARVPFFGGPMLLLAFGYIAGIAGGPRRWPLVTGFVTAFLLMLLPGSDRVSLLSGTYLFRDPMVLYGLVIGGLAWQDVARQRPAAGALLAAVQLSVLTVAAWPFVQQAYAGKPYWDAALHTSATTRALQEWVPRLPGRWYVAPELDDRIRNRALFDDGLFTNVGVYKDLPIVNGLFKGVSTDPIYPSQYLPYGRINGDPATVASAATLDVMGIGAVLATVDEPVSPALEEVARVPYARGEMRLLRNPGVWPGAGFIDEAAAVAVSRLTGCNMPGVLCLDFSSLLTSSPGLDLRVVRRHGDIRIELPAPTVRPRWLLVSEMFRPGWRATAGDAALPVAPLVGGLIGVQVPPGVGGIELRFRPPLRIAATWLSYAAVLAAVSALVARGVWARSQRASARAVAIETV